MDIDWDENKRRANIDKHQVDIVEAALIFENWVLTIADERFDYGEQRYRSIGYVGHTCYVLIHAERTSVMRLISAWKGGRRDQRKYQEGYAGRNPGNER